MTANYFRQYNAGYTVANFLPYPVGHRVTKASALEYFLPERTYQIMKNYQHLIHVGEDLPTQCSTTTAVANSKQS